MVPKLLFHHHDHDDHANDDDDDAAAAADDDDHEHDQYYNKVGKRVRRPKLGIYWRTDVYGAHTGHPVGALLFHHQDHQDHHDHDDHDDHDNSLLFHCK